MTPPTTFPRALEAALGSDPGRPFVTFYDEETGERVELSLTTYANWVAKASSLLVDEHGLERGDRIRIDLPPHWLGLVFLGAAWNTGLILTGPGTGGEEPPNPDVVVCGPATLEDWARRGVLTLACSLRPLGVRFTEALPDGVHDVGVEVWGQPDSFVPWDPPEPDDPAVRWDGVERSQAELWPADGGAATAVRLLSTTDPVSPDGLSTLTGPLATGGSLVLVSHADPARLAAIAEVERVTDRRPDADDLPGR